MSGGKGGSQTTKVEIPQWLEAAARENIARGQHASSIGYTPYYGPDVAAFSPMQEAAFANTTAGAGAFGLGAPAGSAASGMPAPQTFAGGVQGYSSGSLYDQAVAELKARNPGQYDAITGMFINPQTGAAPSLSFGPQVATVAPAPSPAVVGTGSGGGGTYSRPQNSGQGFTSIRDMFDGGGAGRSGSTFSGGPMSSTLNRVGVKPVASKPVASKSSASKSSFSRGGSGR